MMMAQLGNYIQYWMYTDKGYDADTNVRCAAHGPASVTILQHYHNFLMSRERIGIEWGALVNAELSSDTSIVS